MAGREPHTRAHLPKQSADARAPASPQAPAQGVRCLGAAAQLAAVHRTLRHGPVLQLEAGGGTAGGQSAGASRAAAANRTGLPDRLKSGVEALSGVSLDQVKVHYNSAKPAQLNALAYAQGSDIHLAPGQERHLPHEAWHLVQQAQGRVRPTMQMKDGVAINDDRGLEREADAMGAKAAAASQFAAPSLSLAGEADAAIVQRRTGSPGGLAHVLFDREPGGAACSESKSAAPVMQLKDLAKLVITEGMIGYFELDNDFVWLAGGASQGKDLSHVHLFEASKDKIKGQLTVRRSLEKGGPGFDSATIAKEDITAEVIKKFGSDLAGQENRTKIANELKELIDGVIDEWKQME